MQRGKSSSFHWIRPPCLALRFFEEWLNLY
jgi:hypothetical protein